MMKAILDKIYPFRGYCCMLFPQGKDQVAWALILINFLSKKITTNLTHAPTRKRLNKAFIITRDRLTARKIDTGYCKNAYRATQTGFAEWLNQLRFELYRLKSRYSVSWSVPLANGWTAEVMVGLTGQSTWPQDETLFSFSSLQCISPHSLHSFPAL